VHPRWRGLVLRLSVQLAPNVGDEVTEIDAVVSYQRPDKGVDESTMLHLALGDRSHSIPVRLVAEGDQVQVTPTVFYADGTSEKLPILHVPDPDHGEAGNVVVIAVPRADFLQGDMIMLDPLGELQSVVVDTEVRQNSTLVDSRSTELSAAGSRKVWSVRLTDHEDPPVLRYKERRVYRDGGLEVADWTVAASTNLVVGIPAEGVGAVTVTYVGPPPSALQLLGIELELEYEDPDGDERFHQTTSMFIDDHPDSWVQDWHFRLVHRSQRAYTWKLTLLHADGTTTGTEPTADERQRLILRVPQ